jgi:UrcA family protein
MNTQNYFHRIALSFAAASALIAGSAVAADAEPREHVVRFAPAKLQQDSEVAALYSRLQAASRQVCSAHRDRDIASMKDYRACYSKALEDAVGAVNQQTLTALHNAPATRSAKLTQRSKSIAG